MNVSRKSIKASVVLFKLMNNILLTKYKVYVFFL